MREDDDQHVIKPSPQQPLVVVLAKLRPIEDEFAPIAELPAEPVDL